jgi:hypothetical protein
MPYFADLPEIIGFFSYAREDDELHKGRLSALRLAIQYELGVQLHRTGETLRLWQDTQAILPGQRWEAEIKKAINESVFFIPIVTPLALNSDYCRFEFDAFLDREHKLGRADLVFPIVYEPVPALEDEARWRASPALFAVAERQYVRWDHFRHSDVHTPQMHADIETFCGTIVTALRRSWLGSKTRRVPEALGAANADKEEQRRPGTRARRRINNGLGVPTQRRSKETTHAVPRSDHADIGPIASSNGLRIVDKEEVLRWGWDLREKTLAKKLLQLDKKWIREDTRSFSGAKNSGTVSQWMNVFRQRPQHWRLLVDKNNEIIGYWEIHLLFDEYYQQLKKGLLDEDKLAVFMMPSDVEGEYPAYLSMFGFEPDYRAPKVEPLKVLIWSILDVFCSLAKQGKFITEITARAWTHNGHALCRHLGMECILKAHESPNIKIDHWCGSIGPILHNTFKALGSEHNELKDLYVKRGLVAGNQAQSATESAIALD